ncbi:MAG TPA: hypothetical protein PKD83_03195 [Ignavibacteria bacterium]|nr:hypothetical protein [Ignavibacteria bacterium]
MKKKIIVISSLVVILALGIMYSMNNNLIADDKDGTNSKDCSSSCTKTTGTGSSTESKKSCESGSMTSSGTEANTEFAVFEFTTDKIDCDGCKPGMTNKLMGVSGVKEVSYGETCKVSKMTNVKVFYSDKDTTPEIISASVKEKGLECSQSKCGDGSKCTGKNKSEKKS